MLGQCPPQQATSYSADGTIRNSSQKKNLKKWGVDFNRVAVTERKLDRETETLPEIIRSDGIELVQAQAW
jgi:hypothetical protein